MEKDIKELKKHIQEIVDKYNIEGISVYIDKETETYLQGEQTINRKATIAVEV